MAEKIRILSIDRGGIRGIIPAEARSTFKGRPKAKDMAILSLGTGYKKKPYNYRRAKDWGQLGWARPVIDIMMSGVSETVDYQLKQIFDAVGKPKQYLRINGSSLQSCFMGFALG